MNRKLLIVEDDPAIANLLRIILKKAGYDTETAYDGTEFRRLLKTYDPHAILLDLMLGKENGVQVYESMLQDGQKAVPVFVLSAALQGVHALTTASGNQYPAMGKPFEREDLLKAVHGLLEK